jgi:hypothetical protein
MIGMKEQSLVKRFMDLAHLEACLKDAVNEYGVETVRELCNRYMADDEFAGTVKIMELLNADTDISWWNANRARLNEVITSFNEWQTKHRFSSFQKKVLEEKIRLCREFGDQNDFSDWQYDILDKMESFIKTYSER